MTFAVVLLVTALICCVLRNPLRKAPWLFYGLAVVFVVLYLVAGTLGLPGPVNQALLVLMNKCLLPTALFVLVMYVGVFPKGSAIRRWLQPLRTPVSIVACILVLGHMVRFIGAYAARVLGGGAVATNVLVSFASPWCCLRSLRCWGSRASTRFAPAWVPWRGAGSNGLPTRSMPWCTPMFW